MAEPKLFGVTELAKALGIQDASVRVALRKAGIKVNKDGVYAWPKAQFDTNLAKLKKSSAKAPAKKPAKKSAEKKAA